MTLNIVVPVGEVRFVIFDDRTGSATQGIFQEFLLSREKNYQRLTVSPGLWTGFQGIDGGLNLLLNFSSHQHDPREMDQRDLNMINYDWSL